MHATRGAKHDLSSEPLLLDNETFEEWELRSKSREKMEEDLSQFPRFVLLGLEDYAQESVVRLTRKNDNGTLSHFAAAPEELKALFATADEDDDDDAYRSLHAQLYHVVNGEYPGKESHKKWFGWSTRKSTPKLYCYTLNSPDGWMTEKARRRATMTDLEDIVSHANFELLLADFERREMSKTLDIDPLVEAFEKAYEEMVEEVGSDSGEESSSSSEITSPRFSFFGRSSYSKLPEEQTRKGSRFSLALKTKRHEFDGDEV